MLSVTSSSFAIGVAACSLLGLSMLGCGSVTATGDAGAPGAAGSGGAGGEAGAAGSAGAAGQGGAGQAGGGGASGGSGGASGAGGGHAGAGGASGAGGGHAGAGGASGAGGGNACALPMTVDSSCNLDADCVAVTHTTNCCGAAVWLGIRATEKPRFDTLEAACDKTYPGCGCASGPPETDDGSVVPFGSMPGVICQAGTCKTFSKACGHLCPAGRSCTTCMGTDAGATSYCTLRCTAGVTCSEPNYTKCQVSFSSATCVDPTRACGPK